MCWRGTVAMAGVAKTSKSPRYDLGGAGRVPFRIWSRLDSETGNNQAPPPTLWKSPLFTVSAQLPCRSHLGKMIPAGPLPLWDRYSWFLRPEHPGREQCGPHPLHCAEGCSGWLSLLRMAPRGLKSVRSLFSSLCSFWEGVLTARGLPRGPLMDVNIEVLLCYTQV